MIPEQKPREISREDLQRMIQAESVCLSNATRHLEEGNPLDAEMITMLRCVQWLREQPPHVKKVIILVAKSHGFLP
jgi:hypothetical protein